MFITKENTHLLYLLMLLSIFLLLRIVHEYDLVQINNPKPLVSVQVWPLNHPVSCYYQVPGYYLKIDECEQLVLGRGIQVSGTIEPIVDTSYLSQKRLMNVKIVQECGKNDSAFCWFSKGLEASLALKIRFLKTLIGYLPTTAGQLSASMLFGDKSMLSESQSLLFNITGTQHLIAASGYNVGLIASLASKLVTRRRGFFQFGFLAIFIWLYAVWAGLGASIVRAALMQSIALAAHHYHRLYSPIWGLLTTCYLMLFINPWYLSDIGFQLSVAATGSILLGLHRTSSTSAWKSWVTGEIYFDRSLTPTSTPTLLLTIKKYLSDSLKVGILAQIGTLPIVLYHFGEASLWSIVATSLVAWLIPFIMIGTAVVGLMATVIEALQLTPLSNVVRLGGFFVWLLTTLCLRLLSIFTHLPPLTVRAQVPLMLFPAWWGGIYLGHNWLARKEEK